MMEFYLFGFRVSIISLMAIIISLFVIIYNRFASIKGQHAQKLHVRINLDKNTREAYYAMDDVENKFIKLLKLFFKRNSKNT